MPAVNARYSGAVARVGWNSRNSVEPPAADGAVMSRGSCSSCSKPPLARPSSAAAATAAAIAPADAPPTERSRYTLASSHTAWG